MIGTLLICSAGGWVVVMWKLHAISTQVKVLRAELRAGRPLTPDEEEAAEI